MGSGYCKSGSLASWDFLDHLRDWLKMEKELDVISLLNIGDFSGYNQPSKDWSFPRTAW